ncbi:hypothetical protein [Polynucleobacter meluiroseus]|uniref:hypothetical protein n=1 Tax=Polynucleobacter meluiroseus TaxID=1938814 RepID=UPI003AF36B24
MAWESVAATPLALAQTDCQLISLLRFLKASQLFNQAGQAKERSSSRHPGNACHETALKLATEELNEADPSLERDAVPRVGGVEQAANRLAKVISNTLGRACHFLNLEIMIANLLDQYPMILFVAEAAIALGLLLFIVLWTGKGKK